MGFLDRIFGNSGSKEITCSSNLSGGLLRKPGDHLEARVTQTGRQVIKMSTDNGPTKYSATRYPTGTVVETRVTKPH